MSVVIPKADDLSWEIVSGNSDYTTFRARLLGVELTVDYDPHRKCYRSYLPQDSKLEFYDGVEKDWYENVEKAADDAYAHGVNVVNFAKRILNLE